MRGNTEGDREVVVLRGEDWYDHPQWYDILHGPGTAAEARGLERVARAYAGSKGERLTFFEPACGTARHLRHLARMGHHTVGLDRSAAMLDYARPKLEALDPEARLVEGDMAAFSAAEVGVASPGGADMAFCLVNSVRHLPSDGAMVEHLRRVASCLRPGGVYALGIGLTVYGIEGESEDVWRGKRGPCEVTQMVQYLPASAEERVERVVSQLAAVTPTRETHIEHSYGLRSYNGEEWGAVLDAAGMRVLGIVDEEGCDVDWDWRGGVMGYGVFVLAPDSHLVLAD